MAVLREKNIITITHDFTLRDLPYLLVAMHQTVKTGPYTDFTLNFESCTSATAGPMLGLVAHTQSYWNQGIDITLKLPTDSMLNKLFRNSNWAHLIDFRSFDPSTFRGVSQIPTIKYSNGQEQHLAVERIISVLFGALSGLSRNDLRALEWSLNEVTDNVINHAQSKVGGFVQVTNFSKSKRVEFAVADAGVGIPNSLRYGYPDLRSDHEALDRAIREGVTRSSEVGQGNGLFGTFRICQIGKGRLNIRSGYASLASELDAVRIGPEPIPFSGTLVVANVPYASPVDLGDAFNFGGKPHIPTDYVDLHFDVDESDVPILRLSSESAGFGSRDAGRIARNKILNLRQLSDTGSVIVDLAGIPLISSSFADETFGMIFASLGPIQFANSIKLVNVDPLVESLINRAILQRVKQ